MTPRKLAGDYKCFWESFCPHLLSWRWRKYVLLTYRGADKSLARPERKQARKPVRDTCDFNNTETRTVIKFFFLQGKAPKEIHTILTETLACFLPGRAKDLSASLYISCSPILPPLTTFCLLTCMNLTSHLPCNLSTSIPCTFWSWRWRHIPLKHIPTGLYGIEHQKSTNWK